MAKAENMEPAEAAVALAARAEKLFGGSAGRGFAVGSARDRAVAVFESLSWTREQRREKRGQAALGARRFKEPALALAQSIAQGGAVRWDALAQGGFGAGALWADKKWRALADRAAGGAAPLFSFMLGVCAGKALMAGDFESSDMALAMGGDPESAAREIVSQPAGGLADLALARLLAQRPEASREAADCAAKEGWEDGVRAAVEFGGKWIGPQRAAQLALRLISEGSDAEDLKGWVALGESAEIKKVAKSPRAGKKKTPGL